MSDLYRIDLCAADAHDYDTGESGPIGRMILDGVLAPVERCHHDRYDAHWGPHYIATPIGHENECREWCHGAGLEET